jgi:hypothetical protein
MPPLPNLAPLAGRLGVARGGLGVAPVGKGLTAKEFRRKGKKRIVAKFADDLADEISYFISLFLSTAVARQSLPRFRSF